jgi:hypothetical protein
MSSPIIFVRCLPFDSTTVVWGTKSTVNKHIFFCEDEDCGNETHSDTLCDSCRRHLVMLFSGAEWEEEEEEEEMDPEEAQDAASAFLAWEAGEIDDDGNPVE